MITKLSAAPTVGEINEWLKPLTAYVDVDHYGDTIGTLPVITSDEPTARWIREELPPLLSPAIVVTVKVIMSCPFCDEGGFDKAQFKAHIVDGGCTVFETGIPSICQKQLLQT